LNCAPSIFLLFHTIFKTNYQENLQDMIVKNHLILKSNTLQAV